jgi:hypothetical protein
MAQYPTSAATDSNLYIAKNNLSTVLNETLTAGDTTITVVSTANFPTTGYITIEQEAISYTGISGNDFTGCTRGADGTVGVGHASGLQVFHHSVAAHHNLLKDEIKAIETDLINGLTNILKLPDGVAGSPGLCFTNDINTGIYRIGTDQIGIATGGVGRVAIGTSFLSFTDTVPVLTIADTGTDASLLQCKTNGSAHRLWLGQESAAGGSIVPSSGAYASVVGSVGADPLVLMTNNTKRVVVAATGETQFTDGSSALPSVSFINDVNTGFFRYGTDAIAMALGGIQYAVFTSGTFDFYGGGIRQRNTAAGSNVFIQCYNIDNTNASSNAELSVISGGASAGDALLSMQVNGVKAYTLGVDNSDSDNWKLCNGGVMGSNVSLQVDASSGQVEFPDGSASVPSISVIGDSDTGIYHPSANRVAISCGGNDQLIATTSGVRIMGTATNDNAAAGYVGEYVSSVVSGVSFPATTQYGDATSISLTAGDWDISLNFGMDANGASVTVAQCAISTTSGNSGGGTTFGDNRHAVSLPNATINGSATVANYRMSLASTTTVYAKMTATFTVATPRAYCRLDARRVR